MVKILVVFDSKTGNTERMAHLIAEGVREVEGAEAVVKRTEYVSSRDIAECQGMIVGSPVYSGNMTWKVKKFLDSFLDYKLTEGKVGAAFATTLEDGIETTIYSIIFSLMIKKMVITGPGPEFKFGRHGAWRTMTTDTKTETELSKALGRRVAKVAKKLFA